MNIELYGIVSALTVVSNWGLAIFLFVKGKQRLNNVLLGGVAFTLGVWALGVAVFTQLGSLHPDLSLFWFQIGYSGAILIPVFYSHLVFSFCKSRHRGVIRISYMLAFVYFFFIWFDSSKYFFGEMGLIFDRFYWFDWIANRTVVWIVFYVSFYWILLAYDFFILLLTYSSSKGILRNQLKYLIIGSAIGWIGGELQFLPCFRVYNYPSLLTAGVLTAFYTFIFSYAIIRYRLMDISVALTRSSIFIAVYSLVLGLPFVVAFGTQEWLISLLGANWWMAPLIMMAVLATAGPFLYLYINKRAEGKLFEEQIRYQATLKQASSGMGRIKNLNRLINLIVHIVTRTVRIEHSVIYLDNPKARKFEYGAKRSRSVRFQVKPAIERESILVRELNRTRSPIIADEIKQKTQDSGDRKLAKLEAELNELQASLVVPSFIDERLLAIIVLGGKISGKTYSESDIAVFSILSNQAALAIENAMFYDEMKETHEQLFKAEKMATIGTMADGLSHQINNRLHALGFIAGDALDTIKLKKDLKMSDEVREIMVDLEHALVRIQDNVAQGGDVVQGLLKYTRKGEEGHSDIRLEDLINAAIEMTQFKIKPGELTIVKQFDSKLPLIHGNFTQLQEVFFNLIDNAYDAMKQRKEEMKEEGFKPIIKIAADGSGRMLKIVFQDNGMGIKDDDKDKLFTPFFTTKLSSKKGTGLGLYVIQKLIEENHSGRVKYSSKHMEGTMVQMFLPVPHPAKKGQDS